MTLAPGVRLGSYEIRGAVGAGGMGEVYRAHDPRLGRDVALKILPDATARDPAALVRFTREARAVAALNHPHIVTIFSTEEEDGVRFMTMELLEGRTLDRIIPQTGVPLSQFFEVSMALADALSAAHQKQITHRDLKPANVMVTGAGLVKVLDFGLARSGDGGTSGPANLDEKATQLTQAGTIIGTIPYMSPEQIEAKALDGRSDIFSLGIVMYEMATGGRPFRGDTSPALMSSIMKEHPKPATEVRPDLPGDVSRLVGKCLEKDPGDRVQTAQEILLELKALRRAWESGAVRARASHRPTPSLNRDYVIAIHTFTSHGSDEESTGLARGLTDDTGTALSRFQYFTVRASKDADARYAVEGTVRRSGHSIRVSARLVDNETGASLWAENYDRTLGATSSFDLQDEITARVVSTIGSITGPLVKAMASPLREREAADLSLDELVLRSYLYFGGMRIDEHALLRAAFEKALADQPSHALGWAALAGLYDHEVSFGLNPLPDSTGRATRAARRSVELDPTCQFGWSRLMGTHLHTNDWNGMRNAGDRVVALNPLNQNTIGFVGMYFAIMGDWDRGIPMVRRAIDLDPNHVGMLHAGLFVDHYRKKEYEEALAQAKRVNAFETAMVALSLVSAAGQLGRADEARAAFEALDQNHPSYNNREAARSLWTWFLRDNELIDRLVEGFDKARALVSSEPPTRNQIL